MAEIAEPAIAAFSQLDDAVDRFDCSLGGAAADQFL
jgi:hypothetical protein